MVKVAAALSAALSMVFALSAEALACSIDVEPEWMNYRPRSNDVPPRVEVEDVSVQLGDIYGLGWGGPDCSHLGSVEIELTSAEPQGLDERFGARITVLSGELPLFLADDVGGVTFPIRGNRVSLTVSDSHNPALEFAMVVRLVSAEGVLGPSSEPVSVDESRGCTATGTPRSGSPLSLVVLGLLIRVVRKRVRHASA